MVERIPSYDDLQLRIERVGEISYRVLASASDGRTARSTFDMPITDDELDEFVRRVGLMRRRGRSEVNRMQDIQSLGSKLFNSLIKDEVRAIYQAARAAAQENDRGLRITLRLSDAPELMRLPWELMYSRPKFLSQSIRTPVVRSLDLATKRRPMRCDFPLKILGVVSSPEGEPELNVDDERRRLESALSQLKSDGLVKLEWLERATLAELGRRFSKPDDIHVLHYIGHGAYDESNEGGILVLETLQGRSHDVSGADLGTMLQDEESLRLVVLNSCEGARTSRIEPFSGVATSLLEFEIPAVIGMQFEISDEAAIAFSESLYTGLAHGLPVDAALAPARRAISAKRQAEFGTPVLFLRATDARLFNLPTRPAQTPDNPDPGGMVSDPRVKAREAELDDRYAQGVNYFNQAFWDKAVAVFTDIEQKHPGFRDAASLLMRAEQQRDLAAWSDQAAAASRHQDWATAIRALEKICAIDPTYRDAGARLEQARLAHRLRLLVDKVTRLHQAGQWKGVLAAADELAELDPDNPDPGGMVSDARVKVREAELDDRYAQGVNHLNQAFWEKAVAVFTDIEQEHPGFRDAASLLMRAEQQRDLAAWYASRHQDWATALRSSLGIPATLIAVAALIGQIPPIKALSTNYEYNLKIWLFYTAALILIGIAFFILAWMAKSLGEKVAMLSAALMVPVVFLHVVNKGVLARDELEADVMDFLKNVASSTVLALAAMVGILFGVAVIRKCRVVWAFVLIAWGVCGLLEAFLWYEAKIAPWRPGEPPLEVWKVADSVLVVQNLILLAVAVFMFLESRPAKTNPHRHRSDGAGSSELDHRPGNCSPR